MDLFEEMIKNEYPDTPDSIRDAVKKTVSENVNNEQANKTRLAATRHRRYLIRIAAVAALFVLVPTGVYAASQIHWPWSKIHSADNANANQALGDMLKEEDGCIYADGFRFKLEEALCDPEMGVSYCCVSVSEKTGQGRNPHDYFEEYMMDDLIEKKVDEGTEKIAYNIHPSHDLTAVGYSYTYDEERSTDQTAYFYLHFLGDATEEDNIQLMNKVEISINRMTWTKLPDTKDEKERVSIDHEKLDGGCIDIQNIIKLPSKVWEFEDRGQTVRIKINSIAAKVSGIRKPVERVEIVSKDDTSIALHTEDSVEGDIGEGDIGIIDTQTAYGNYDTIVNYNFIDLNQVKGIRVNEDFYPIEDAH